MGSDGQPVVRVAAGCPIAASTLLIRRLQGMCTGLGAVVGRQPPPMAWMSDAGLTAVGSMVEPLLQPEGERSRDG